MGTEGGAEPGAELPEPERSEKAEEEPEKAEREAGEVADDEPEAGDEEDEQRTVDQPPSTPPAQLAQQPTTARR